MPRAIAGQFVLGGGDGRRRARRRACDGSACARSRSRARRPRCPPRRAPPLSPCRCAVAGSRSAPRWPMTKTRSGACGTWVAKSMSQRRAAEGVEIFGEGLPVPRQAFRHARARGCPRRLPSRLISVVLVLRPAGREADAAVAHHHGGDAVARRGREALVPGRLAVVVGVDVDEARRHELALGVDLLAARAGDLADRGDAAVLDGDIGLARLAPVPSRTVPLRITRSKWAVMAPSR